jgi:hypothetical protein
MNKIRGVVVAVLLGVWTFPAVSSAMTPVSAPAPISAPASNATSPTGSGGEARTASLAAREQQSRDLQDYKGGAGVVIYASSGAILVAVIVLLILLV